MLRWIELLSPDQDLSPLDVPDQIDRILLSSILSEVRLSQRKLLEVLVTLINFSTTNEDLYYEHFLFLAQLEEILAAQADFREFYNAQSSNLRYQIEEARSSIERLESDRPDLATAWYRRGIEKPGVVFRSVRQRLLSALRQCTDRERAALGFAYGRYSALSQHAHFTPPSLRRAETISGFSSAIDAIGILGMLTLLRCADLAGTTTGGLISQLQQVVDDDAYTQDLVRRQSYGEFEVGDIVVVFGYLGQVIETSTSRYNYRAFRVVFLDDRPISSIIDDWFRPSEIQRLFDADTLLTELSLRLEDGVPSWHTHEERLQLLAEGAVHVRRSGLRDELRNRSRPRGPGSVS